ncbi:Protein kinase domain-containing protein [Entamoeba marina]
MTEKPTKKIVKTSPLTLFGEQEGIVLESKKQRYHVIKTIGWGTFGIVIGVTDEKQNIYAVKRVIQEKRYKNRELQIVEKLKHPNVIEVKDFFYTTLPDNDDQILNLVMDCLPCNLSQILHEYSTEQLPMPLRHIRLYTYQLSRALSYIHSQGICHRDVKPQNILIDPDHLLLKLCDFGTAKILSQDRPSSSYICTRYYRAPELIFGCSNYTTAIDIWSLGCILSELLTGHILFRGESSSDQLNKFRKILGSPNAQEVIAMNKDSPYKRMPIAKGKGIEEVLMYTDTPDSAYVLLNKILQYDPTKRPKALDVMLDDFCKDMFRELMRSDGYGNWTDYSNDEWNYADDNEKNRMNEFCSLEKKRNLKFVKK